NGHPRQGSTVHQSRSTRTHDAPNARISSNRRPNTTGESPKIADPSENPNERLSTPPDVRLARTGVAVVVDARPGTVELDVVTSGTDVDGATVVVVVGAEVDTRGSVVPGGAV